MNPLIPRMLLISGLTAFSLALHAQVADVADEDVITINGCALVRGTSCPGVDLRQADLRHKDLSKADFTGANLEFARFSAARMHEVILRAANLEMAWLPKADLKGADLSDANLQESKMNHANLESATMTGTRLHYGTYLNMHMTDCTDCPVDWEAHLSSQAR